MSFTACSVSVMDDSDPEIVFDAEGVCNHVHAARWRLEHETFLGDEGKARLEAALSLIRAEGAGKPYDCIMGVSGGVDSSYAALLAKQYGLRPLAVHVDVGWNTDTAVSNIERMLRALDIDLYTNVVNWEEIKDLQRAYFRAGVLDIECVADHAIYATLFHQAEHRRVRWILSGMNVSTESILPKAWSYDKRDSQNLRAIHRQFGERALRDYPTISVQDFVRHIFLRRTKFFPILNYHQYRKADVLAALQREVGYAPYARKHGESRFTRFYQEYYLPRKFGYDKRKAHLSSLIVAGQMDREAALAELNRPLYAPGEDEEDLIYVAKKLDFEPEELAGLIARPGRRHQEFANSAWAFDRSSPLSQIARYVAKGESGKGALLRPLEAARRN